MLFQMRDDDPAVIERLEELLLIIAGEVNAQGRCHVAVERIRTGAPAIMDASFQQAIEAASVRRFVGIDAGLAYFDLVSIGIDFSWC